MWQLWLNILVAASFICLHFTGLGASAIELAMTLAHSAVLPGASVRIDCAFWPTPGYIFWRFSANSGATWRKLALCHTESGLCGIQAPFSAEWAAVRPAAFVNGSLLLAEIGREQDGEYECEGIAGTEAAKASRSLTVLVAPGQPTYSGLQWPPTEPVTVVEGGKPLVLSCQSAGGNPPPDIVWLRRRRGSPTVEPLPAGAANWTPPVAKFGIAHSDLRLAVTAADNLAEVACRCEHQLANATSAAVVANVMYRPKVVPVSSQMVLLDDRVEFNCSADANPPAQVYVARDNFTVSATGQQFVRHIIPSAGKPDSGNYACTAVNTVGASRSFFYLDVQYPPEIAIQGVLTAREGGRLVADCAVSANPPPYLVRWRHEASGRAAANASQLVLDPVARADAGQWTCEARSSATPTTGTQLRREFAAQSSADLIVEYPPGAPEIRVSGSRVVSGQPASLVCQPSPTDPGVPVPTFSWKKYGTVGTLLTAPILQLSPATLTDNGLYYCTPENSVGPGPAASVALEVVQPPAWLSTWPEPQLLLNASSSGPRFELDCSALAKPEALVRWFKDGAEVNPAEHTIVAGYNVTSYHAISTLKFTGPSRINGGLRASDNGEYLCTAQNGFGKIDRTLRLVVEFAPQILSNTAKVALASAGVSLECLLESQPEPTVTWELLRDGTSHIGNLMRESQPPYRYRATLPGVREPGGYACRARNRLGEQSHMIQVVHRGSPEAPDNLTVTSVAWDHVVLAWRPGFDGGLPATHTVTFVSMSDVGEFGMDDPHSGVVTAGDWNSNVTGLLPDTNYALAVRASNSLGAGRTSANATARTAQLLLPSIGHVRTTGDSGLSFSVPSGCCVRVEVSTDGGIGWSPYRQCDLDGQLGGLNFASVYRLRACLLARRNICGPSVSTQSMSSLPEVSSLTIAVVASGCAVLIVCLFLVLIFFCCRNRSAKNSSDSDHLSHRDTSSVDRKVSSYVQYGGCGNGNGCVVVDGGGRQQYAMVSPHPSLTSTDETSVDQGSSKVFATLVSANNPLTAGTNNEGSESDHSGSPLQPSRQPQRKIIYEVVV